MPKMIFVNLPVRDVAAATRFYAAIGCEQNPQFSNDDASSMMWSDTITFQLLARDYFATFTAKSISDASASCEALIALTCDSREEVDALVQAGATAGGKADARAPMDLGFLYNRMLEDPDGHTLELAFMDMSKLGEGGGEE